MKSPLKVKVPNTFGSGLGSALTGVIVIEEQVIEDRSMRGDTFMIISGGVWYLPPPVRRLLLFILPLESSHPDPEEGILPVLVRMTR